MRRCLDFGVNIFRMKSSHERSRLAVLGRNGKPLVVVLLVEYGNKAFIRTMTEEESRAGAPFPISEGASKFSEEVSKLQAAGMQEMGDEHATDIIRSHVLK